MAEKTRNRTVPPLAAAFEPAGYDDWRDLVDAALKGASFDGALLSRSRDGLELRPIYSRAAQPADQPSRASAGPWSIVQRVEHPDIATANALARADLEGGADGLELVFGASLTAGGAGIGVETVDDLDRLLDGIDLANTSVRVSAGHENLYAMAQFAVLAEQRNLAPGQLDIVLDADPVAHLAFRGKLTRTIERMFDGMADFAKGMRAADFRVQLLTPDGRYWHHGGATEAQELALVLATAVTYLRGLEKYGADPANIADSMGFAVAADTDQLLTIAKIRALRRLWARLREAAGIAPRPVHVHAETAWRTMSACDPHTNILRGTLAAFAAGIGGADSVTILPFTAAIGIPDELARRIARNTQKILLEEANLHRVTDAAAGSGAIEALTESLAKEAWKLFQSIEADGGMFECLKKGRVQSMISAVRDKRMDDVCRLKELMVGTTAYADPDEPRPKTLSGASAEIQTSSTRINLPETGAGKMFGALVDAARNGVGMTDMTVSKPEGHARIDVSIARIRLAEPFEMLRAASDSALKSSGRRPRMFLAGLSDPADHSAREAWIRDVLATGGIVAQEIRTFSAPEDAAEDFEASGLAMACIFAEDPDVAAKTATLLREAGAKTVLLAADPGERRAGLESAGIGLFAYRGCNVVELMADALSQAGIGIERQQDGAGQGTREEA